MAAINNQHKAVDISNQLFEALKHQHNAMDIYKVGNKNKNKLKSAKRF